jgi:hypothetical protein
MNAEQIVQKTLRDNPEIRLVLDIAARARQVEEQEAPRNIGVATDVTAVPTNLPYPAPPVTFG